MDLFDIAVARKLSGGGGGSSVEVTPLEVTENGTYTAPDGTAYSPVTVNVPTGGEINIKETGYAKTTDNQIFTISGLLAEPKAFHLCLTEDYTIGTGASYIISVDSNLKLTTVVDTGNNKISSPSFKLFGDVRFQYSYSNGTLTLESVKPSAVGYFFKNKTYKLSYIY